MGRRKKARWDELPDMLTVAEAAPLVRMTEANYYYHAARGRVPNRKVGKRIWIPKSELMAWMGIKEEANEDTKSATQDGVLREVAGGI